MQKTIHSVLRNPAARALILIVLIIPVSTYLGTSSVRRGFLYHTATFAPSVVAAIAAGVWTYSWKWFWVTLGASGALTMLIEMSLYLVR
jgi:hypothetical protein